MGGSQGLCPVIFPHKCYGYANDTSHDKKAEEFLKEVQCEKHLTHHYWL